MSASIKRICFVFVAVFATMLGLAVQPAAAFDTNPGTPGGATNHTKPAKPGDVKGAYLNKCEVPIPPDAQAVSTTPAMNMPVIDELPPTAGNPSWDGADRANSIIQAGNQLVVGGLFDGVHWQGKAYTRHSLVIFDAKTGEPSSVAPAVDGEILGMALACSGTAIYVVGDFDHVTVNGQTFNRRNAAKINLATGDVYDWNPSPDGLVNTVAVVYKQVVLGGGFTHVGGATIGQIASVNSTAGTATSWLKFTLGGWRPYGGATVRLFEPNHAGTVAILSGSFTTVNGKSHPRIALVDTSSSKSAKLLPWYTSITVQSGSRACSATKQIVEQGASWTPDDTKFGISSTGGGHVSSVCDAATLWSGSGKALSNTAAKPLWIMYTGSDSLSMNVMSSTSMYVAGHNRWCGTGPHLPTTITPEIERPGICQISLKTGKVTSWNPTRSRQRGMHISGLLNEQGLWIASDGQQCAGQELNNLCLLSYK